MKHLDEEYQSLLADSKLEWNSSKLTKHGIRIKELILIIEFKISALSNHNLRLIFYNLLSTIINLTLIDKIKTDENEIEKKKVPSILITLILFENEEWRGFIGQQKYEWEKSGLSKNQITRKEILFFIGFFFAEFKSWLQLLRVLSWIKLVSK
jgi:hypothetical protein